jgi:hypothetical protein
MVTGTIAIHTGAEDTGVTIVGIIGRLPSRRRAPHLKRILHLGFSWAGCQACPTFFVEEAGMAWSDLTGVSWSGSRARDRVPEFWITR